MNIFRSSVLTFASLLNSWILMSQSFPQKEILRWEMQAKSVTIIRDKWGIPHVYGKKDSDAVFGLMYAECEDDFKRVELNYIEKLGRLAEINGESDIYKDLYTRLIIDSVEAKNDYVKAPPRLKVLLDAFADGINYYLYKNREVKPALLNHFEPWYALLWTDGSIGAISTGDVTETDVRNFYSSDREVAYVEPVAEKLTGSNGFAIAPSKSASGNAMLYINPHVTFYFRPEVHMSSEEGLNVYGAVTWGQFFIYQGFNEHCGWMHTSNKVDVSDMYAEKIFKKEGSFFYEYEKDLRPVKEKKIIISYRDAEGYKSKTFKTFYTHHGPVMAKRNDRWISIKSYNRSLASLVQSWQRTKTVGFTSYKAAMELRANTSNNTVYADASGNIAYWHGNYIPVRDTSYNWAAPVDGSTSRTEWKGLHTLEEMVHIYNPINGWIQNCNSTAFSAAGAYSPVAANFPNYMAPDAENYRGINAVRVLSSKNSFTLDDLIAAGYDKRLAAFEKLVPALVSAFNRLTVSNDTDYTKLQQAVQILKTWDLNSGEHSVATTLAVEWGERLIPFMIQHFKEDKYPVVYPLKRTSRFLETARDTDLLNPFKIVLENLDRKFGTWKIEWGSINRFQRISPAIAQVFNDSDQSLPVGFVSSAWGQLPSYSSNYFPGTNKRYGVDGNSFICAVEFGKHIRAKSLLAGGESGDPSSPHFKDQAEMYSKGIFKDVLFYKEDVMKNMERSYHPGE